MIIGIGNDILDIRRLAKTFSRHPQRLTEKLLSPTELIKWQTIPSNKQLNYLAKRWAAKEAIGKAFGTGIRNPVLFSNITVDRDNLGKPLVKTHNELHSLVLQKKISNIHVSLSDEPPYCLAFVVIES